TLTFFSSAYPHHPDLHSFPTRRSSDLLLQSEGPWLLKPDATRVARHLASRLPRLGDRWTPRLGVKTGADELFLVDLPAPWTRPRSEEHTSELQSLAYLVCRLLLEKKKK